MATNEVDPKAITQQLNLPDHVWCEAGENGMPKLVIRSSRSEAHVYLHGSHVTHWQPNGQAPALFMSERSHFAEGQPIRGGVPVIFPWFGPHENQELPSHGFARIMPWIATDARLDTDDRVHVRLQLTDTEQTRQVFPHAFELQMTILVGKDLGLVFRVANTGETAFAFEEALHTYFAIFDIRETVVRGLTGVEYLDQLENRSRKEQNDPLLHFRGETDRIFINAPHTTAIQADRIYVISKAESASTVVWNPWSGKAARMPDFGDDEWPNMVCVESGNVADNAVTLQPGESHKLRVSYISVS